MLKFWNGKEGNKNDSAYLQFSVVSLVQFVCISSGSALKGIEYRSLADS